MNFRKITSLTLLISFLLCVLTSIILYIVPDGRIAFWSVWQFWGLSKTQWGDLHLNWGILLLLACCMHIYYNWKPIVAYLKDKTKRMRIFTANFNCALLLALVFGLGTYFQIPPMSTILNFRDSIKGAAAVKYGEPPYGHAELSSLKTLATKASLDLATCLDLLKQKNIRYENENQSIITIAGENNLTPQQVYDIILPAAKKEAMASNTAFPDTPPPNFGRKKITEMAADYNLKVPDIIQALNSKGVKAEPTQSIKEIATLNNMEPLSVFKVIQDSINNK